MVGFKKDSNFIHNGPCIKGTVMQIEKKLKNDGSQVSKVSRKFHIPFIYNFAVIYL